MPRFRKKPITIEARQILDDMAVVDNISRWITTHGGKVSWPFVPDSDHVLSIETMEGEMVAGLGDWIIRGVAGEFYPCKPDIFEQTYEPVGGDDRGGR